MPWGAEEDLAPYIEAMKVINEVDPMIIAIEQLVGPELDAVVAVGRSYVIISWNSLKDNFADKQP